MVTHRAHPDLNKERDILFAKFPPGQVPEAADHLARQPALAAEARLAQRAVAVRYQLTDHTLRELEDDLADRGFHLDNTLFSKLMRALIYYVEETQLHNLGVPEKRLKRSNEAYMRAWEQHAHGDHDDTPPEWRDYK
ncbi:hypothetical protein OTERR_04920 [Oryzomicrobium terrae]|uniref:Uncharacterized protein n=1 Tax=Oryzomicrobium terrae TaxID=1735038 RepID=A0A5C1E6W6_9RHOO|nr:hypothetical protein [Oryzomicrobium terrae]QEL63968.1 hypothetical protein OTERR_04920 [Oryzomicrobium terrae]